MNSVQSDFSDEPRSSGSSGDYKPAGNNAKRKPPAVPRKPDKGLKANGIIEKVARYEFLHCNNSQHHPTPHPTVVSPKVFRAGSVTVNAPAKDVLGTRVVENLMKYAGNGANTNAKNSAYDNATRVIGHDNNNRIEDKTQDSSNNVIVNSVRAFQNDNKNLNQQQQNTNLRIKTPSPSFNRNPQNVALKHTVQRRAEETSHMEGRMKKAQLERIREQENEKLEKARLDEILTMFAEYQQQNANFSKQTMPNRIKTNGSLSRDKKSPFCTTPTSNVFNFDVEFTEANSPSGPNSYENVRLRGSDQRGTCYENVDNSCVSAKPAIVLESPSDGPYENVYLARPVIPNSPRTRIKTYLHSPKKESTADHEHSLELKLLDAHNIKELHFIDSSDDSCSNQKETENTEFNNTLEYEQLKKQRQMLLDEIRRIKTKVTDIQSQQEELFREADMEEALLSAEYDSETTLLTSEEQEKTLLMETIREIEAKREKVKREQDVIQNASSEKVWKAKEAVHRIELDLKDNPRSGLVVELMQAHEAMDNEKKIYEDLEFQYLEADADLLAQKEELHNKVASLTQRIDERKSKLKQLETQKSEVFNSTCKQTRVLEQNQLESIRKLERNRNYIKDVESALREMGWDIKIVPNQSDAESEDELLDNKISVRNRSMTSLHRGKELSKSHPKQDLMTTSMNDNILRSHIESIRLDSGYTSPKTLNDAVRNASEEPKKLPKNSKNKSELERQNGVVMYNCNNIPKEKSSNINTDKTKDKSCNYMQSLTSDIELSKQFELFSPECLDLIKSKNPPASLMTRVPSQDDIDRISKVTSKSPICTANGGSKAAESLRQIEKNRHLLLHMKGSQVIESARQRVSELRLRAQSEVRAKWEKTHPNTDSDFVNSDLINTPDLIPTNESADEKTNQVETDMKKLNVNGESDKSEFVKSSDAKRDGGSVIKRKPKLELIEDLCKDREYSLSSIGSQHSIEGELDGISNESGRDSTQLQTPKEVSDTSLSDSRSPTDSGQLCNSSSGCEHSDSLLHLRPLSNVSDLSSSDTGGSAAAMMVPPARSCSAGAKLTKSQRPLTRYLPITSDQLDLREHMHASGHLLETCPHVRVDALSCRGYLQKLCTNTWNLNGWGKRWFVFDRSQRALVYYTDKSERKPRGGAYFQAIVEVYMDHAHTAHNVFIVKTHQRVYRLTAPSSQAARIWIEAITTGAMGSLAYDI